MNITIQTLLAVCQNLYGSDLKKITVEPNYNVTVELSNFEDKHFHSPSQAHKKLVDAFYTKKENTEQLQLRGEGWEL